MDILELGPCRCDDKGIGGREDGRIIGCKVDVDIFVAPLELCVSYRVIADDVVVSTLREARG